MLTIRIVFRDLLVGCWTDWNAVCVRGAVGSGAAKGAADCCDVASSPSGVPSVLQNRAVGTFGVPHFGQMTLSWGGTLTAAGAGSAIA